MRLSHLLLAGTASLIAAGEAPAQQVVDDFVSANGHVRVELEPHLTKYRANLEADADTILLPDSGMGPLEKSALFIDAVEGELPITRWLYRLGQTNVPVSTGGEETLWFVDVTRFNVGPAWRESTAIAYGDDNTASAEEFGTGPSVSWRIVLSPVMGMTADIIEAGRREWTAEQADGARCFGEPCLSTDTIINGLGDWADEPAGPSPLPLPYEPAAAARLINFVGNAHGFDTDGARHSRWNAPEKPERLDDKPDAFIGGLIETGIGQDPADEVAMIYSGVNDDSVKDIWKRVIVMGDGVTRMAFTTPWR